MSEKLSTLGGKLYHGVRHYTYENFPNRLQTSLDTFRQMC